MGNQIISKQRVLEHGEVYTNQREVSAMLDLVKQETERIESRFLEPACGTGNFLAEVLSRKLYIVEVRYVRSQLDYERNAVLAVSSVYGIDILADNVNACRERLFEIFDVVYSARFKRKAREQCRAAVHFILEQNIVEGDALTLQTVGNPPQPIEFSEWSPVRGSLLKRRVFAFHQLMPPTPDARPLFAEPSLSSDLGDAVFIPLPVREYPATHFLKVAQADV
ncbi:DNA methyltransferase [Coleofasciculus sp. H7-2]|uniref:DNA methyltransferase n=1 Tax=Coleofasciculus sp. H7-2 TaxID=3351545 RepID=UPI003670503A